MTNLMYKIKESQYRVPLFSPAFFLFSKEPFLKMRCTTFSKKGILFHNLHLKKANCGWGGTHPAKKKFIRYNRLFHIPYSTTELNEDLYRFSFSFHYNIDIVSIQFPTDSVEKQSESETKKICALQNIPFSRSQDTEKQKSHFPLFRAIFPLNTVAFILPPTWHFAFHIILSHQFQILFSCL